LSQPFGDCKNEALHNMGAIQPYGALIAINATDHTIEYCSKNVADFLGQSLDEVLGAHGTDFFAGLWPEMLRLCDEKGVRRLPQGLFPFNLDVAVHCDGKHLLFEFEKVTEDSSHWWNYAERVGFLERLEQARTLADCRRLIVRELFERTGFDRVMLYRFYADMHGKVVEERIRHGVDSFLGIHFPADDIPPNAQRFYTKNWQRIIADVNSTTVPIVGRKADTSQLDLTTSMLRAVHPVHIQYLKNMDVTASFSVSIVIKGSLHALVACHNSSPKMLGLHDRLAFEEMARMVSLRLENLLELQEKDQRAQMTEQLAELATILAEDGSASGINLARHLGRMQELVSANTGWISVNGENMFSGPVPNSTELDHLKKWFETLDQGSVSNFSTLPEEFAAEAEINSHACGILYLPLPGGNFIALLRPEQVQEITWAGEPPTGEQPNLTPRSSFAAWVEQNRGTATPWSDIEVEFATKLRKDLLKYSS